MALTTQFFGMKINRYMQEYGITQKALAQVSAKAFHNGSLNEMAWRREPLSEEDVLQSQMLSYPLTQYMFCSPGEGGVALILARADQAHKYTEKPIFLDSAVVRSRRFGSFEVLAPSLALEHSAGPTVDASKAAFEMAGIGPEDIDVAQLQDTESGAEIMHMAENGFCEHGEQEAMLANGDTKIDGRFPVNTDGGCLANGEPVGASGLRQVYENVLQLRGDAGARQVPNDPKTAYTHVYGAPGISGVTILSR
jgi:acetyl-CoA acetyltransferase